MPVSTLIYKMWISACLVLSCVFANYAESRHSLNPSPQLTVVTEHWFPFNYLDEAGEISGTSTMVVKKVLDKAGINYSLNLYPWSRAFQIATTNKNVVIYSIMRTPQREDKFQWICPLQPGIPQFIFKLTKRADITASDLQQAKGYKIGVNRGSHSYELIVSMGWEEGKDFTSVAETSHYFTLLLKGRVDLFVDTQQGMLEKLALAGLPPDYTTALFQLYSADLCMAASLDTEATVVDKIRDALSQINEINNE